MYAIIKTGGKQYTVKPGDVLRVEKLEADLGSELKLTEVILVGGDKTFVGANVSKATVTVVVTNQQRGPKVVVFKKRRRQGYRRMGGHRQPFTELFVKSITSPEGQTANAETKPAVFSPEKKAARMAKSAEVRELHKEQNRKAAAAGTTVETTPAKKAAKKSTAKKAGGAKQQAAGKKTTGKKVAKKTKK